MLSLAWPSVIEQSLVTLIGLVDAYIVGHLGAVALAGVGPGSQVLNLAALFTAVGVLFAHDIMRIFGAEPGVVEAGASWLRAVAPPFATFGVLLAGTAALRGGGDTRSTMLITVASIWGLRLAAASVRGLALGLGLYGARLALGLDFASRALLFWRRFRGGRWIAVRV